MKTPIISPTAPPALGPYEQGIIAPNGMVFFSGQLGIDREGNLVQGGITAQTKQALDNISHLLVAAGLRFSNIVKTTVFLANIDDFSDMNAAYSEYFPENPPARSTIGVAALPKGALVEIEIIASKGT